MELELRPASVAKTRQGELPVRPTMDSGDLSTSVSWPSSVGLRPSQLSFVLGHHSSCPRVHDRVEVDEGTV